MGVTLKLPNRYFVNLRRIISVELVYSVFAVTASELGYECESA